MTAHQPKISVIIPSFNQGAFIEETLKSLIDQRYEALELIVIDGNSMDGSMEIIKAYDHIITYWISEKDSGQSEAINKGFAKATGDIITWLNSDDCYEPGTLQRVAVAFEADPALDVLHGKALLFGKGVTSKVIGPDKDIPLHGYFSYMRFPQPSSFLRHQTLKQVLPVNNTLHYAMDFELIVKLILRGASIKRSGELFSRYRLHPSSKSNDSLAFMKEWSLVIANAFYTLPGGREYLDHMLSLELVSKEMLVQYPNALQFNEEELQDVFLQHINTCYHFNYRALNREACQKISDFLRTDFPSFYSANNYRKYNNRLKFIPKFVFRFFKTA